MKKILSLICGTAVLAVMFAALFMAPAQAAPNYIVDEGFETIAEDKIEETYFLHTSKAKLEGGIGSNVPKEGLKCLKLIDRADFYSCFRVPLRKDDRITGTPVIDFNKTYAVSFYVKFDKDIDNFYLQFAWRTADLRYENANIWMDMDVGEQWVHMSGTFNLKELMVKEGKKVTSMPDMPELCFLPTVSKSPYYLDDIKIVEGNEVPGVQMGDNAYDREQQANNPSQAPSKAATPSSQETPSTNLVIPGQNSETAVPQDDTSSETTAEAASDTVSSEVSSAEGAVQDNNGDSGGVPVYMVIIIVAGVVVVLGAAGFLVWKFVLSKKPAESGDKPENKE